MEVYKGDNGKVSSKRVSGLIILSICIVLSIVDTFTNYAVNEFIFGTMFGGGCGLLGVEAVFNRNSNRKNNQRPRQRRSNPDEG